MFYLPYVDKEYYLTHSNMAIPDELIERYLSKATRHIDSLTYNRIVGRGFSNLTQFQQEIIKEVICSQAEFELENSDLIDTVLSSYSINGVSMQFGSSWNLYIDKGIAIKKDIYCLLEQTGLVSRRL